MNTNQAEIDKLEVLLKTHLNYRANAWRALNEYGPDHFDILQAEFKEAQTRVNLIVASISRLRANGLNLNERLKKT